MTGRGLLMQMTMDKMRIVYLLGRQAFGLGEQRKAPQSLSDDLAKMWLAGWDDASESEERKTNPRQPSIPDGD